MSLCSCRFVHAVLLMLLGSCSLFMVCICSVHVFPFVGLSHAFVFCHAVFCVRFSFLFVLVCMQFGVFFLFDVFPCDFDSVFDLLTLVHATLLVILLLTCVLASSIG